MSLHKRQPRLLSTNLTVDNCSRSQSSRSSISDLNWSESNTVQKNEQLGSEDESTALLDDYNGVFVLMNELKSAVDALVQKVNRVVGPNRAGDTVHGRLFDMLSAKISDLSKVVKKTRATGIAGSSADRRRPSVSVFSPYDLKSGRTIVTNAKTSITSLRIIHRKSEVESENSERGSSVVIKRKNCTLAKSDPKPITLIAPVVTPNQSTNQLTSQPTKQPITHTVSAELLSSKSCKTNENPSERKSNLFDIILSLNRMNFIDHDQVVILKKCVIRKDERVLKALRSYEGNKDLQVLVCSIGSIIESCDLPTN